MPEPFQEPLPGATVPAGSGVSPGGAAGRCGVDGTSITPKGSVQSQNDLPASGNQKGDMYFTSDGHIWIWDGSQWVDSGSLRSGAVISPDPPSTGSAGDFWFDSTTQKLYIWFNGQWTLVDGVTIAGSPPSNPSAGDLWFDSAKRQLYVYYNGQWVPSVNPAELISTDPGNLVKLGSDNLLYASCCVLLADDEEEARTLSEANPGAIVFYPEDGGINAYQNGKKVWTENASFLIDSGSDAAYIIPTGSFTAAPYNWQIDWGDGSPEQTVSGTASSSNTTGIPHTYPAANTEYKIKIVPVNDEYGWLRAYGNNYQQTGSQSQSNKDKLLQLLNNPKAEALLVSSQTTGNDYCRYTFSGCSRLRNAWKEDIGNVTTIGDNFRSGQYSGCTSLTEVPDEVIPDSVTSIGNGFRSSQYNGCTFVNPVAEVLPSSVTSIGTTFRHGQYRSNPSLTRAADEVLPASVTTIGQWFRGNQYTDCTSLTTAAATEVMHSVVTTIGASFRYEQYKGCTSLTQPVAEVLPITLTTIGDWFRMHQYEFCSALTRAAAEVLPANVTSVGDGFRAYQYSSCSSLTQAAAEVFPAGVTTVGGEFRGYQYAYCNSLSVGSYIHSYQFATLLNAANSSINYTWMFYVGARLAADTMPRYWTSAAQTASNPVNNLTPTVSKSYVKGRTGISGYASLHVNWTF